MKNLLQTQKSKFVAYFLLLFTVFTPLFAHIAPVQAQEVEDPNILCEILPFLNDIQFADINIALCSAGENNADPLTTIGAFIRFGLSLIFIVIIGIAVVYIIRSAITYIRSEGNEEKVEEARKAIKAVFIGVGALFVGILGLVLILTVFNASSALSDPTDGGAERDDDLERIINPLTGE